MLDILAVGQRCVRAVRVSCMSSQEIHVDKGTWQTFLYIVTVQILATLVLLLLVIVHSSSFWHPKTIGDKVIAAAVY